MKMLLMPALGAAFFFGTPPYVLADPGAGVQMSQLMVPGQPGFTTSNRTLTPGSPGIAPLNRPSLSPFGTPSGFQPRPALPPIGIRGNHNQPEPEAAGPGEPDEAGRIGPTVDRSVARYAGERGPDGKLLPTYVPREQAQAPAAPPPTPPRTGDRMRSPDTQMDQQRQMQRDQDQMRSGQRGATGMSSTQRPQPQNATAMLNRLSAEGYTVTSDFRRVGDQWEATANKAGRTVTVQIDPRTQQISER